MVVRTRKSGSRNWTRGLFAFLWILLAGFSGFYLFTLLTDPTALGSQTAQLSGIIGGEATPSSTDTSTGSSEPATASIEANGARDRELAEIKASLRELSQQMAELKELNTRLKPPEKPVGPVAASPPATSVPPPPVPAPSRQSATVAPPAVVDEPVVTAPPVVVDLPEQPKSAESPPEPVKPAETPEPPKPVVEAPKPTPVPVEEAKPAEQPKPATPAEEEPQAAAAAPAPVPAPVEEADAPAPEKPTETAALDPVTLPPAANDGSTRYGIEIGSVPKQDELRPLWREFLNNHAALVAGLQPRRVLAPDKKWRLIAGPFANAREAEGACALFKKASRPCEATVYAGDAL